MRDPFLAPLVGFGSVRFAPSPKLRLRPSDFAQDDTLKDDFGVSVTKLIRTKSDIGCRHCRPQDDKLGLCGMLSLCWDQICLCGLDSQFACKHGRLSLQTKKQTEVFVRYKPHKASILFISCRDRRAMFSKKTCRL